MSAYLKENCRAAGRQRGVRKKEGKEQAVAIAVVLVSDNERRGEGKKRSR